MQSDQLQHRLNIILRKRCRTRPQPRLPWLARPPHLDALDLVRVLVLAVLVERLCAVGRRGDEGFDAGRHGGDGGVR